MSSALVLIANGTEVGTRSYDALSDANLQGHVISQEMEFTIAYDTLVRAGIKCQSAFVPSPSEAGLSTAGGWGVTADVVATCSRGTLHCPNLIDRRN